MTTLSNRTKQLALIEIEKMNRVKTEVSNHPTLLDKEKTLKRLDNTIRAFKKQVDNG